MQTPDVVAILGNDKISPYPWPKKKTDGRRKESAATTSPGGGRPGSDAALAAWATAALPNSQHALQVHTLSEDFRAATRLVSSPLPRAGSLPRGAILIRRLYTGVNASDVNFTAGRYHASKAQALSELPFNAGPPACLTSRSTSLKNEQHPSNIQSSTMRVEVCRKWWALPH